MTWRIDVLDRSDAGLAAFQEFDRPRPGGAPAVAPPADATLLLARAAGAVPVARAAIRLAEDLYGAPPATGTVGWYEARDGEAGVAVLEEAKRRLADRGATLVLGPMDGTTWDRYRLALPDPGGADRPPFFTEPTNPPEYPAHFQAAGFREDQRYLSRLTTDLDALAARTADAGARLEAAGIAIEPMPADAFDATLDEIHGLSVRAFARNPYYSPIGRDRFRIMYTPLRPLIDPSLVLLARDRAGDLLGFMFAFPDLLDPATTGGRPTRVVLKSMAVAEAARGSGLGSLLMHEAHRRAAAAGYAAAIHALMHEANDSLRISSHGGTVYRHYALYRWAP